MTTSVLRVLDYKFWNHYGTDSLISFGLVTTKTNYNCYCKRSITEFLMSNKTTKSQILQLVFRIRNVNIIALCLNWKNYIVSE